MKIISNFKDYYDYLQGIYGVDEKVVYARTSYSQKDNGKWIKSPFYKLAYYDIENTYGRYINYEYHILGICGIMYSVHIFNQGKHFLFGCNFQEYKNGDYDHILKSLDEYSLDRFMKNLSMTTTDGPDPVDKFHLKKTNRNLEENCPVVLLTYDRYNDVDPHVIALNVRLTDFSINQIVSPHDMYISISNFLSREVTVEDTRTDKQKIVGKGFDYKSSFRKVK